MPIKDSLPGSKPHLMLPGAISFQSKANKLPQSTTQVLINIQTFAFKSSPVYRSFPSICETWDPLCCVTGGFKCLFERGNVSRGTSDCSWTLFSPQTHFISEHVICSLPAWGRGGAACVGGQCKLLIIHIVALLSATSWSATGCFISISNIWGNWAYLVCILMAHTTFPAEFGSVHRAALPIIIDQSVRGVKKKKKKKAPDLCRDSSSAAGQDSLITFHTADDGSQRGLIPA